jgi:hypothetical protein
MTLLTELERNLGVECNLINDPTSYSTSSYASFALLKDWGNVTLSNAGLLLIFFQMYVSGSNYTGYVRIKVGSNYVYCQKTGNTSSTMITVGAAIYLAAGTYDVRAEGCNPTGGGSYYTYLQNFQCGYTSFNDLVGSAEVAYGSSIALTVSSRLTPMGTLNQAVYLVQCMAYTSGAVTNFNNVGDSLTNGVSITIDGVQKNWSERCQDTDKVQAASARLALPFSVGSSHTIVITKSNSSTVVDISVVACPWILGDINHSPVNMSFSQGSTAYANVEPLFLNPTKFVGVGMVHGVSFGAADDYYASTSAVDVISFSYTFLFTDLSSLPNFLFFNGTGGCIVAIGVDVK